MKDHRTVHFVATVEEVALLGLKPVFVDVDPDTMMMDMDQVEAKISSAQRPSFRFTCLDKQLLWKT